jgi:hypothetical protein
VLYYCVVETTANGICCPTRTTGHLLALVKLNGFYMYTEMNNKVATAQLDCYN